MQFIVDLLETGHNRPGTSFSPSGIVLHSTDDLNATATAIRNYFNNNPGAQASAHLAVDWTQAVTMIPWQPGKSEIAWHAGPTANRRYLGIEWCETDDPSLFAQGYGNFLTIVRTILDMYRWPVDPAHVFSHAQTSQLFHETDHTDPLPYLSRHGKTWDQVVADVAAASAVSPFPDFSTDEEPAAGAVLREGAMGPSVQEVQNRLKIKGFDPGSLDGVFGPQTTAAVVAFQTANNLVPDGLVGPQTLARLRA